MGRTGVFTPVLAKHSKDFSLVDGVAVYVDRMPRNFKLLAQHIELVRQAPLTGGTAKLASYRIWHAPSTIPARA